MKKGFKIVSIIVFTLVLIWSALIITDGVVTSNFHKKPIFASADKNTIEKDGGSGVYKGLGYSITLRGRLSADTHFYVYKTEIKVFGITIYKNEE